MSTIGIIAPSGVVPSDLLVEGVNRLLKLKHKVFIHPQVHMSERYFAGSDSDRALAFLDYAYDLEVDTLWAARGGYGCIRILPILDELTKRFGVPPKKRLFGFSDITLLMEYVRVNWGWEIVHAPMPATQPFLKMNSKQLNALHAVLENKKSKNKVSYSLKPVFLPEKSKKEISGVLLGGNQKLIQNSIATPYAFQLNQSILFIEEVGEPLYAIDRDLQQLLFSGQLDKVKAIVLGTFSNCEDKPIPGLRKPIPAMKGILESYREAGAILNIPVFSGLKVGHGNEGVDVLPLGKKVKILGNKIQF